MAQACGRELTALSRGGLADNRFKENLLMQLGVIGLAEWGRTWCSGFLKAAISALFTTGP